MTPTTHRTVAVLKLPTRVTDFVKFAQAVLAAMTGNTHFPNPSPTLAAVTALITALANAETATQTRAKGTVPARNAARAALLTALHQLKAYVQQVADADPDNAAAIIVSSGLSVQKTTARDKQAFTAKPGTISGSVDVVAKAVAHRAAYEWEWSADGGKTWTTAPATLGARTTVTGLPVGTSCTFRFRPLTKTGEGDWSQVVTVLVK
jgi:hypothetical protein